MTDPPRKKQRIIIDTDPGIDDALAILLALNSPEIEVIGLTSVFGNADVSLTTRNALAILSAAGRTDIPVAAGAAHPLAHDFLGGAPHVHGEDGLGGAAMEFLPASGELAVSASAVEFIWQSVLSAPRETTLLALGPLTNLAMAMRLHPELPGMVAQVVAMGGNALVHGNATPSAEANIHNDPEAADVVFGADWPVTMVGLDVTRQVVLPGAAIDEITSRRSRAHRLLERVVPFYRSFAARTNAIDGILLHDPAAVAFLLAPSLFETKHWPIRVETQGMSRGKTWPSMASTDQAHPPAWRGRPAVQVCVGVDGERVAALVRERLLTLPE
jgi:purine nucleosidase